MNRFTFTADEDVQGIVSDTRLQVDFSTGAVGHKLLVGLDYQRTRGTFVAGFGVGPTIDVYAPVYGVQIERLPLFADNETPLEQIGVYAQEQARWNRWIVTLGGRHDWVDTEVEDFLFGANHSQEDSAFSGRIGLNYVFDSGFAPYAAISNSFEPTTGTDRLGNPFDPVTAEQAEVGIKYQPPGLNSLITLAAYELTQQDVRTPDPLDPFASVQTGEARARGVELEAVGRLNDAFSFNLSYAHTDTEITQSNAGNVGEPLPHRLAHRHVIKHS